MKRHPATSESSSAHTQRPAVLWFDTQRLAVLRQIAHSQLYIAASTLIGPVNSTDPQLIAISLFVIVAAKEMSLFPL